ncbi:hypothetical protein KJ673_03115 [Patescibacteria group bacterium]|nr:hypothetical protein [Patescibacteria group bacterium]MCG2687788.1 hypothetical protein [Candidatus Parcubacteria bacterium]
MSGESNRPGDQLVIDAKKGRALSKEEVVENDKSLDTLKEFAESKIDARDIEFINKKFEDLVTLQQHSQSLLDTGNPADSPLLKALFEGANAIAREINGELSALRNQIIDDAIAEYPDRISGNRESIEYEYLYRQDRSERLPEPYRELSDAVNQVLKEKFPFADTIGLTGDEDKIIIGLKR